MATKYTLNQIQLLSARKIFVDANILIYIFWPTGSYAWESNYSTVFGRLLRQQNELFVDFFVISEVVNRILRTEHQKLNPSISYKKFRNSSDGISALEDIYLIIKDEILTKFKIQGKSFDKNDIELMLHVDSLDIIDKSIVAICKENNLVLLTNDADYLGSDIDILSSNPKLN